MESGVEEEKKGTFDSVLDFCCWCFLKSEMRPESREMFVLPLCRRISWEKEELDGFISASSLQEEEEKKGAFSLYGGGSDLGFSTLPSHIEAQARWWSPASPMLGEDKQWFQPLPPRGSAFRQRLMVCLRLTPLG